MWEEEKKEKKRGSRKWLGFSCRTVLSFSFQRIKEDAVCVCGGGGKKN